MVVFKTVHLKYEADYRENQKEDGPKRRDSETHPDVTAAVKQSDGHGRAGENRET